jgi:hypothetical protein
VVIATSGGTETLMYYVECPWFVIGQL